MNVRGFEGWLAGVLGAQPWAEQVTRWSTGEGPKPVGLTLAGRVHLQLVGGDQKAAPLDPNDAGVVPAVEASPTDPAGCAEAITRTVAEAGMPRVKSAETYAAWGGSTKPGGMRVVFVDGSELFASIVDSGRR
ncbi:hypothetical protein AB0K35_27650 [Micromonospora sp. NPDC053740]|uniref:hypothetical protein n=1 Tax=Micromonospora sp. NPDC053740 TaxID=3155173 RepID=UPI003422346E